MTTEVEIPPGPDVQPTRRDAIPWRLRRAARSDRRLLARSSLTLAGRTLSKLAIAIFLVLAARVLSTREFAVYSYVLVLAYTFGILADPQVSVVAGRDVSAGRDGPGELFWAALPVVVATALLAATGVVILGTVAAGPGVTIAELLLAALFVVLNRLFALVTDLLRALGRFGLEAAIETGGSAALVATATALAASGAGITAVLGAFAATAGLQVVVCLVALRSEIGRPVRPRGRWRPLLRAGLKLSLAAGGAALATRGPLLILGATGTAAAVAALSAAQRFADGAYLIALTAGQALLPGVAALAVGDRARAVRLTRRVVAGAFVAGGIIAALASPFAGDLAVAVFGSRYATAGAPLAVMLLALPLMGVFWVSFFALIALGREWDLVRAAGAGALTTAVVGAIAIPGGGATGAAWTYVAGLAAMALASFLAFEARSRATALVPGAAAA